MARGDALYLTAHRIRTAVGIVIYHFLGQQDGRRSDAASEVSLHSLVVHQHP